MKIVAGVDEVGRGSLIGPVYAAAVILNNSINQKLLKDSKSLTKEKRNELYKYIRQNSVWAIGQASTKEIEKINIILEEYDINNQLYDFLANKGPDFRDRYI